MEINTRSNQIAKSSVYDKLKKMAFIQEHKYQVLTTELMTAVNIDLCKVSIEIRNRKIQTYSEKYPLNKVMLLEYDYAYDRWSAEAVNEGKAIGVTISKIAKKQIYPSMCERMEDQLVLKISIDVWNQIDSWAS